MLLFVKTMYLWISQDILSIFQIYICTFIHTCICSDKTSISFSLTSQRKLWGRDSSETIEKNIFSKLSLWSQSVRSPVLVKQSSSSERSPVVCTSYAQIRRWKPSLDPVQFYPLFLEDALLPLAAFSRGRFCYLYTLLLKFLLPFDSSVYFLCKSKSTSLVFPSCQVPAK